MRGSRGALACAVAATALWGVGCGSDDNDALSKSEYIKQGNAICQKVTNKLNAAGRKLGQSPSRAQLTAFVNGTLVPTVSNELQDLRALKAPKGDSDQLSQLYDDAEAALNKVKANPSAAFGEGGTDPFAGVNKRATAYGLTVCGAP